MTEKALSPQMKAVQKREWNVAVAREILNLSVELQGEMSSEEALGEIARMARLPVDVAGMLGDIAVRLDRGGRDKPREEFSKTAAWTAEYLVDRSGRHAAQNPDRSGEKWAVRCSAV